MKENVGSPTSYSGFGVFPFILLNWAQFYLSPISFIGSILPSSRLSLVRLDHGSFLDMPIITWCDALDGSITRTEKHQSCMTWWKSIVSYPNSWSYQEVRIQVSPHTTWCVGSLESSEMLYEGSYGLSVFLHNTSLNVTQDF